MGIQAAKEKRTNETLLQRAQNSKVRTQHPIMQDDINLAIAWMKGDVTTGQVVKAYNTSGSYSCMYRIAITLREAYLRGVIKTDFEPIIK